MADGVADPDEGMNLRIAGGDVIASQTSCIVSNEGVLIAAGSFLSALWPDRGRTGIYIVDGVSRISIISCSGSIIAVAEERANARIFIVEGDGSEIL
jgi:hypothetical protein